MENIDLTSSQDSMLIQKYTYLYSRCGGLPYLLYIDLVICEDKTAIFHGKFYFIHKATIFS